jgi:hypothetical protein
MARETQGLQIALIISVMLMVVFGGMTYYWYRQYEDANTKAIGYSNDLNKSAEQVRVSATEIGDLKRLIGVADTDAVKTIKEEIFKQDMTKYGGGYPEGERDYRRIMEKMQKTIDDKNASLADEKTRVQGLEQQIKVFEASKQPQIDDFQKSRDDAGKDLADERAKFNADRERITRDQATLQGERDDARKERDADRAKAEAKFNEDGSRIKRLAGTIEIQANEISKITSTKIDAFDGEVRWVDQRSGSVWINRGRADALPRQITFSIYPPDTTDLTATGSIKASIEVTQILGDNLALARVIDDKITDPIIPGDKIHTPLWAPGEKRHFAVAGFMDVYGDGKSNMQTVLDLIKMNDGVVDAYVDDKGNVQGAITVSTRYLILGLDPTEHGGTPAEISAFSKLFANATSWGIQKLPLNNMLQRMGWKNTSPVVRYGAGADPKDFAPKREEGALKKSAGTVSDIFKPRQPSGRSPSATPSATPSRTPPSAYQRF